MTVKMISLYISLKAGERARIKLATPVSANGLAMGKHPMKTIGRR